MTAGISVPQIDGSEPSKSSWKPGAISASWNARVAPTLVSAGVITRDAAPRWRRAEPTGCGHELAGRLVDADVQARRRRAARRPPCGRARRARAAGHAPGQARDQPAVRDRVVGGALGRGADRAGRELLLHREVVEHVLRALGDGPHAPQAGAVREQVAHGHPALAARGELRPVRRDRLVVGELAALREPVHDRRGDALGRREAQPERLGRPRPRVRAVGPARAEVQHGLAAHPHDQRGATAPAAGEPREGLGRAAEAGRDVATDVLRQRHPPQHARNADGRMLAA